MSRVCQVTGKRPQVGNNVSHANNKTRRRFLPNLHNHRFWVESENRFVRLRVSSKGMRIMVGPSKDRETADALRKKIASDASLNMKSAWVNDWVPLDKR